jgi:hypothetical protein
MRAIHIAAAAEFLDARLVAASNFLGPGFVVDEWETSFDQCRTPFAASGWEASVRSAVRTPVCGPQTGNAAGAIGQRSALGLRNLPAGGYVVGHVTELEPPRFARAER